jgi:hypothetical protein
MLCALTAAASMSPALASRLTSLSLGHQVGPDHAPGKMFLPPLGRLTALTKLGICSPVDEASTGWLAPSLVELALRPNAFWASQHLRLGTAWLDAAAACTALRVLDLVELHEDDLGGGARFVDVLNQVGWVGSGKLGLLLQAARANDRHPVVGAWRPTTHKLGAPAKKGCFSLTSLEELRGIVRVVSDGAEGVALTASRPLLLPRLRCLLLYMYDANGTRPLFAAPLEALRAAAPLLQELAVRLNGPGPGAAAGGGGGAVVFPQLRRLHMSICEPALPADPVGVARTSPSLTELVFGHGAWRTPLCHYPLAALPLLPLQRFSLESCRGPVPDGGAYTHLARCSALTSLVLNNIQGISTDEVLQAARAPRLRELVVAQCTFAKPRLKASKLKAALRAAAAGHLVATVMGWAPDTILLSPSYE